MASETGSDAGEGYTINLPMMPGANDDDYRRAFSGTVIPAIDKYGPQFVLLSAGFDAHRADPLAPLNLETESYGWMTDEVLSAARRHCEGRLISILEGGYNLDALGDSVTLHVTRMVEA